METEMSRTTRASRMDHWSTKRRQRYVADSVQVAPYLRGTGDIRRDRAFNNYDQGWGSDCHEAFDGPRGFCTWSEVGRNSKSSAKRGAAKMIRRRGIREIRQEVRSLGAAD
jgi:hypothetical protein